MDAELNDAESTKESTSCTLTKCKDDNNKYQLECAGKQETCTSPPSYQLQLFLTKGYQKFICCKYVEIASYLHAITFNQDKSEKNKLLEELGTQAKKVKKNKVEITRLQSEI